MLVDVDPVDHVCEAGVGEVTGLVGLPGEGKTHLAVECWLSGRLDPVVAFSPTAIEDARPGSNRRPFPGQPMTLAQALRSNAFEREDRILIVPDIPEVTEARDADRLLRLVRSWYGWTVILDDVADYADEVDYMLTFATRCGHHDNNLIAISQSELTLSRKVRRHLSRLAIFTATDEADIQDMAKRGGQELVDAVRNRQEGDPPVLWRRGVTRNPLSSANDNRRRGDYP